MGKILWLASYPRSGNTWLRVFLHNLLRNPDAPHDINRLQELTLIDSQARWYQLFDPRPLTELTKDEVAALRPRVHAALAATHPDTVFVKTHNALFEDRGTPMVSLEHTAGAIYVVRNPLDVAVSYAVHFGVSHDEAVAAMGRPRNQSVANQANFAYALFGSWSENVASWTSRPHDALHVVRYEDMATNPERTFGGVVNFLRLNVSADRLGKAIHYSSFEVLKCQEQSHGFGERSLKSEVFFRSGQIGQGAQLLRSEQIETIRVQHREQMARFGYE
ncbi:MAG: sulfotransferase domain-containing protein [Dongiaceae bacterium]